MTMSVLLNFLNEIPEEELSQFGKNVVRNVKEKLKHLIKFRLGHLTLYREMTGEAAEEREVDRSELYFAEEAFLCGTGQEIVPVASIDRLPVGDGSVGPLTRKLRQRYFETVRGLTQDHAAWRTLV